MKPMADELPLAAWFGIAVLLLVQGTWLFLDARKRLRYPWFWGIWGLTGFPTPLIVYLIVRQIVEKRRKGLMNRRG